MKSYDVLDCGQVHYFKSVVKFHGKTSILYDGIHKRWRSNRQWENLLLTPWISDRIQLYPNTVSKYNVTFPLHGTHDHLGVAACNEWSPSWQLSDNWNLILECLSPLSDSQTFISTRLELELWGFCIVSTKSHPSPCLNLDWHGD